MKFAEEFERAPFVHEVVTTKHHPSGKLKKVIERVFYVPILVDKGSTKYALLQRNNLSGDIHPEDCMSSFLPN